MSSSSDVTPWATSAAPSCCNVRMPALRAARRTLSNFGSFNSTAQHCHRQSTIRRCPCGHDSLTPCNLRTEVAAFCRRSAVAAGDTTFPLSDLPRPVAERPADRDCILPCISRTVCGPAADSQPPLTTGTNCLSGTLSINTRNNDSAASLARMPARTMRSSPTSPHKMPTVVASTRSGTT